MTTVRIEIHAAGEAAFRESAARLLSVAPSPSPALAGRLVEGPGAFVVAARDEASGEAAGSALVLLEDSEGEGCSRPWLAALYVAPALRGRGLGRRLVRRAEEEAARRGHRALALRVHPEDDTALFTAERWGFVRQEILLVRELPEP